MSVEKISTDDALRQQTERLIRGYQLEGGVVCLHLRRLQATVDAQSAELARLRGMVLPEGSTVVRGFDYDSATGEHIPNIMIVLPRVKGSENQKPWEQRDALAAALASRNGGGG